MLDMPYTPSESPEVLYEEKVNILSPIIGTWIHGVLFSVTILCIHTLLSTKESPLAHRRFHIGYVCLLFVFGTCGGVVNVALLLNGFIDNRDFPGGPMAYFATHYGSPLSITGFSAFVVATWLQDGYLLYRFILIYKFRIYVCAVPALMFLSSVACSCILLNALSKPGANIWKESSINLATPYWTLSITLNVILTTLIVIRILWARRQNMKILGGRNDKIYTTVATLLIESAALYSVIGVIYLGLYRTGNTMQEVLVALLGEVQCISPMLIIYRVAKGAEWSPHTARHPPLDTIGPYALSTVRLGTTHLQSALEQGNDLTDTTNTATSSGAVELIEKNQRISYPERAHVV